MIEYKHYIITFVRSIPNKQTNFKWFIFAYGFVYFFSSCNSLSETCNQLDAHIYPHTHTQND